MATAEVNLATERARVTATPGTTAETLAAAAALAAPLLAGIPLAASGLLSPVLTGAATALSSGSAVSNALPLRRWHPREAGR